MRIAIVEDHVLIAKQLVALVTLCGHTAVAVSNGTIPSLRQMTNAKPELAFVDISLFSENTGLDIADHLIHDYNVPTVFITANRRLLPAGFYDAIGVIDKPFNKLSFEKALNYIVARLTHAATSPSLPISLILSPLFCDLWNEAPAANSPRRAPVQGYQPGPAWI